MAQGFIAWRKKDGTFTFVVDNLPSSAVKHLQALTLLCLCFTVFLQADSWRQVNADQERKYLRNESLTLNGDEASGSLRAESTNLIHRALTSIIQLLGLRASSKHNEASLVNSASDLSVDILLTGNDRLLQELTLGWEVQTIVKDLGVVERDELITKSSDLTIEDKTLEIDVCGAEAGQAWSFVAATGFETNEAVLNDVDTSHTMSASNGIGFQEKLNRICDSLTLAGDQLLWQTLLEH